MKKRLAIMQPYLFPYIGYFQLVGSVDRFVFFDDVNFIKRGWINRNRLLFSGSVGYFTIPLVAASQNHRICDIQVCMEGGWQKKLSTSIRESYSKAPYFHTVYELVENVIFSGELSIANMAKHSVLSVAEYLDLNTQFVSTSSSYGNEGLTGPARILDICRSEDAGAYYNLPGGRPLYDRGEFSARQIELKFVEPLLCEYRQYGALFQPWLSVLDVLMFNDKSSVIRMLNQHDLT
jgi:hypothetical protein